MDGKDEHLLKSVTNFTCCSLRIIS